MLLPHHTIAPFRLPVLALLVLLRTGLTFGLEGDVRGTFDFGHLDLNAEVSHTFPLRSPFDAGLAIKKVSTSCKCAIVQSCPSDIDAEEDGYLDVRVIAESVGDFAYEVKLQFTDETVPPWVFLLLVSVEGNKPGAKLYLKPASLKLQFERPTSNIERPTSNEERIPRPDVRRNASTSMFDVHSQVSTLNNPSALGGDTNRKRAGTPRDALTVIDIRSETLFRQVRVKDSLHVPSYALRFKTWLKSRDVVLVDGGLGSRDSEQLCLRLMAEGFRSVAILQGGIAGWHKAGGALDGDPAVIARGYPMPHAEGTSSPVVLAGTRGTHGIRRISGGTGTRRRKCGRCL
jgi:rhodanese-related sulfurtransferase